MYLFPFLLQYAHFYKINNTSNKCHFFYFLHNFHQKNIWQAIFLRKKGRQSRPFLII